MKFNNSKQKSTNVYELDFNVEAKIFNEHLDKAFIKNAGKINIAGFRKGKAPRSVVEKFYGTNVFFDEALNELWPGELALALKEAKIDNFIAVEKIDVTSVSKEDGVHFLASVITKPAVKLGRYKGIEVESQPIAVTDEEVEKILTQLAKKVARVVPVADDAICQKDSFINLDCEGFIGSKPIEGGKCENYDLMLNQGQFFPEFEEKLLGHKKGEEFEIEITFPADYIALNLANKKAKFNIKINNIKEFQLPKMDDEFAKDISDFDTIKALRENVYNKLLEEKEEQKKIQIKEKIFDKIVKEMTVDVPDIMNRRQIDEMVNNFSKRLKSKGIELKEYLSSTKTDIEEFKERFREKAERQVKVDLAIEKISELENIKFTAEDAEKKLTELAEKYKFTHQNIKDAVDLENIRLSMKLNKATELVINSAIIKEKI